VARDLDPHDDIYHSAAATLQLARVLAGRAPADPDTTIQPPIMSERIDVSVTVNGARVSRSVQVRQHLVGFLREELGLTGSHLSREHGVCGACTVRVDGEIVRGCLMLAAQVDGCVVETIEGLSGAGAIGELQREFHQHNALQCGFCTPGILIAAAELVEHNSAATRNRSVSNVRKLLLLHGLSVDPGCNRGGLRCKSMRGDLDQ
jgi:aerobic-type carbon monoxide dehydrogenase small subunit (CoxS/CutS family)